MLSPIFDSNSLIITSNQEYRCPKCFLIPFIKIFSNENNLFMSIKCTNNHFYSKSFEEMQIMFKTNLISCDICENENKENKNNNLSNSLFYCPNCYKFFCIKHRENHNLKEGHKILFNNNFDNNCFEHNGNTVIGYCKNHNKNYCLRCIHFNENNKNFDEELNEQQIKDYENGIEIIKKLLMKLNYYSIIIKNFFKNLRIIFIFI